MFNLQVKYKNVKLSLSLIFHSSFETHFVVIYICKMLLCYENITDILFHCPKSEELKASVWI